MPTRRSPNQIKKNNERKVQHASGKFSSDLDLWLEMKLVGPATGFRTTLSEEDFFKNGEKWQAEKLRYQLFLEQSVANEMSSDADGFLNRIVYEYSKRREEDTVVPISSPVIEKESEHSPSGGVCDELYTSMESDESPVAFKNVKVTHERRYLNGHELKVIREQRSMSLGERNTQLKEKFQHLTPQQFLNAKHLYIRGSKAKKWWPSVAKYNCAPDLQSTIMYVSKSGDEVGGFLNDVNPNAFLTSHQIREHTKLVDGILANHTLTQIMSDYEPSFKFRYVDDFPTEYQDSSRKKIMVHGSSIPRPVIPDTGGLHFTNYVLKRMSNRTLAKIYNLAIRWHSPDQLDARRHYCCAQLTVDTTATSCERSVLY